MEAPHITNCAAVIHTACLLVRSLRHDAANEAMLKWLRAPALPRPFVLELLDFVLGHSAALFRDIPAFEHALLVRVCMLLTTQLQNLLDPACDPALQARLALTCC